MPTINRLPLLGTPSSGDQIPVYAPNSGDARRMSINSLVDYFQDTLVFPDPENAAYIDYDPAGAGAVSTTVQSKLREMVSVKDFGAKGDLSVDDTAALQAAINYAQTTKIGLLLNAGEYMITSSLVITDEIFFQGEGSNQSKIVLYTASKTTPAILVDVPSNSSFIGGRIGGFTIRCNGGTARGIGLRIQTTATNSAVSLSVFENLRIIQVDIGVYLTGVIYMSTFRNIVVSLNVDAYGWYASTPQEIIYNSFEDIEVTHVNNNAWAYYFFSQVLANQFRNVTCDGVCYFGGAYNRIQGLAVEGIYATVTPSAAAVTLNQIGALTDAAIINIPNSKCTQGINITSANTEVSNVRFPDSGAGNQPDTPIIWGAGQSGVLSGVRMDRAPVKKLEDAMPDSTLAGFLVFNCSASLTDRNLQYYEGSWAPGFATWSTAPTVSAARYIRVGRMVTVFLNYNGGACADGSTITGLPFTSNSSYGGTATSVGNDVSKRFNGVITTSSTTIGTIPAQTLTGVFSQLTATYFAA